MAGPERLTPATEVAVAGRYCDASEDGVTLLGFDPSEGTLSPLGAVSGIENPSWVTVHPERPWVFAVEETGDRKGGGRVVSLRFDLDHGTLTVVNRRDSSGGAPCHLVLDPTGRFIVVSNYMSGTVATFPINDDGSLGKRSDHHKHKGSGPHPQRQERPHAHSSMFTPDGSYLLTTDLGTDQIIVYRFDSSNGRVSPAGVIATRPRSGPRHMAFDPAAGILYVSNELDSSVCAYSYDGSSGSFRELAYASSLPPGGKGENLPSEIEYDQRRGRVYVANRGHDSVIALTFDGTATLQLHAVADAGGRWPRHFAIDPSGQWMLVTHERSGWISALALSDGEPAISSELSRFAMPGASCVQFSGRRI